MLRTAIVNPPAPDRMINPCPMLGPSILKTFLKSHGYELDLVDLAIRIRYINRFYLRDIFNLKIFENFHRTVNFLENSQDVGLEREIDKIIELGSLQNYDVIGFNFVNMNLASALCIAKVLKEKYGKKIIFGGAITTMADYKGLLDLGFIDFLVIGDGEEPFLNILHYFEGIGGVENCDGILYKKNGKIHFNKPAVFPLEKSSLPSFDPQDFELYKKLNTYGLAMLPYLLEDGCRFKCAFCYEYKNTFFKYKAIEKVISDIKFLLKKYGANSIFFAKGNFNNDPAYMKELSERIISEGLKFSWGGYATLVGLDESIIKVMARAGCKFMFIGVESGAETISNNMNLNKKKDMDKFKETLKLLHKYGIGTHNFYIVEFPYETYENFKETISLIKEMSNYVTTANPCMFELADSTNAVASLVPQSFGISMRTKGKYSFMRIGQPFDEINGLEWEDKEKIGILKERLAEKIIFKQMVIKLALKSLIKKPMSFMKKLVFRSYPSFGEYHI